MGVGNCHEEVGAAKHAAVRVAGGLVQVSGFSCVYLNHSLIITFTCLTRVCVCMRARVRVYLKPSRP